ncbi:hypothetical protein BU26DRAFT_552403 [Trematosphaeria pertusa]|uniref:Uncharacterized protein n=1 Tax=Trematosphaeria pertusa TaxID=390896 RepID=A0A6A6IBZ0_9PLEO|nr:uncharacterized protein BU26DRAFT_552403 [Trematosphaeria pertusa]KAF2247769.1 hypothetical protein BU26DRAFT_552403 [Trematosphaeria pertusa]
MSSKRTDSLPHTNEHSTTPAIPLSSPHHCSGSDLHTKRRDLSQSSNPTDAKPRDTSQDLTPHPPPHAASPSRHPCRIPCTGRGRIHKLFIQNGKIRYHLVDISPAPATSPAEERVGQTHTPMHGKGIRRGCGRGSCLAIRQMGRDSETRLRSADGERGTEKQDTAPPVQRDAVLKALPDKVDSVAGGCK